MNNNLKAGILLFGTLILSRLLPLPANSEPLLGIAVLTPYISKSNLAFLFPLAVMFVSDAIIGFHNSMIMTYTAIALAPFVSKLLQDKIYTSLFASWLIWHVFANIGQLYPPFSLDSLLFDIRFLISGFSVVALYDLTRRLWQYRARDI